MPEALPSAAGTCCQQHCWNLAKSRTGFSAWRRIWRQDSGGRMSRGRRRGGIRPTLCRRVDITNKESQRPMIGRPPARLERSIRTPRTQARTRPNQASVWVARACGPSSSAAPGAARSPCARLRRESCAMQAERDVRRESGPAALSVGPGPRRRGVRQFVARRAEGREWPGNKTVRNFLIRLIDILEITYESSANLSPLENLLREISI